jgi:Uncharacterised nucleotidyltransferase
VAITHEHKLLLSAALDPPERAVCSFTEWWKRVDLRHTGTTEYRLLPLVFSNIGPLISDTVAAARVKGVAKHVWLSNHRNAALGAQALDALAIAKAPCMVLKGGAIMSALGSEFMRSMDDCDILIPQQHAPQALAALAGAGLQAHGPTNYLAPADYRRHHGFRRPGDTVFHVDIHWRPLRNVGADELTQEFFAEAVACQFSGRKTLRPCFEHMLLHTIVHGTEWAVTLRYDWLADAALILRGAGQGFDWDRLADTADRYRLSSIVRAALAELTEVISVPLPPQALRRLPKGSAVDRAEARWRSRDPATAPLGRHVIALQTVRRQEKRLMRRSIATAGMELWREMFGPPPRAMMRADMVADADDHVIYLSGWQPWEYLDPPGRWTDGALAVLAIQRPPNRPGQFLRLSGHILQAAESKPQVIDVYSGWRRLARLSRHLSHQQTAIIRLPAAMVWREVLTLRLWIHHPASPADLGLGADTRKLGLFLRGIRSTSCIRDAVTRPLDLRRSSSDLDVLLHGWSAPEPHGCWIEGNSASLLWTSPHALPPGARLIMDGDIVLDGREPLTGHICVNGHPSAELTCPRSGPIRLTAPLPDRPREREIHVHFKLHRSPSWTMTTLAASEQKLGLRLHSVRL